MLYTLRFPALSRVWCLLGLVAFTGCYPENNKPTGPVQGLRPVYASLESVRKVEILPPQPMKTPGKIYVKDAFLFINEPDKGLHVVNNLNPEKPVKVAFIAIPGNTDMAVKGTILYANNITDLVALDISNLQQIRVTKRLENMFPYTAYPAERGVRFECADPAKGVVVRWESAELMNPKCYR
ncbi:hypothetical protein GCM10023187_03280 [Nibrella viscosa]|uniref:LVIVD repeat-containing protein n=1 Tax=Nibrella viscosa TaxID=1084524 RepID=A0ABP8JUA1_9BACT